MAGRNQEYLASLCRLARERFAYIRSITGTEMLMKLSIAANLLTI